MHLLQQKLAKSTTRWNNKKLRRGLSRVVIIHQSGTVDLVYKKWGHGPQCEQQHAKTRGLNEGTGLVTSRMSTQTHTGEKKAQNQGSTLSSFHTREKLQRAGPHTTTGPHRNTRTLQTPNSKGNIGQIRQLQKLQASHQQGPRPNTAKGLA